MVPSFGGETGPFNARGKFAADFSRELFLADFCGFSRHGIFQKHLNVYDYLKDMILYVTTESRDTHQKINRYEKFMIMPFTAGACVSLLSIVTYNNDIFPCLATFSTVCLQTTPTPKNRLGTPPVGLNPRPPPSHPPRASPHSSLTASPS